MMGRLTREVETRIVGENIVWPCVAGFCCVEVRPIGA